jgi:hypothetical protein
MLEVIWETWAEHIERMVGKCKKVLNVMCCLMGKKWRAGRSSLRTMYVALIRSVIDYGSIAYGWAPRTSLKRLEVIQGQGLRICSGAFQTSPVDALQVDIGDMPLQIRRQQLAMNYWVNLKGHGVSHSHPQALGGWVIPRRRRWDLMEV